MKVQMEVTRALTAVIVAALAISSVSDVRPTSIDKCNEELMDININCSSATFGADNGPSMCCNGTSWLYKNDFPCFCHYHRGTSDEDEYLVLADCGISTGGRFSCSAPPAITTAPPPPALLSPPPPTSVLPSPPVEHPSLKPNLPPPPSPPVLGPNTSSTLLGKTSFEYDSFDCGSCSGISCFHHRCVGGFSLYYERGATSCKNLIISMRKTKLKVCK